MTRQEFENSLKSIFQSQVFNNNFECFEAVYTNDQSKVYDILTRYLRALGRIAFYLGEWDAAPDQPSKDAVVGSVNGDLGNASVDPSSALMWPDAGGLFGNVKGPSSATDQGISVFNGTTGKLLAQQEATTGLVVFTAPVNGKVVGNTLLGTVPAGKTFIPVKATYTLTAISGLSLVATVSVGSNSPNYNNISAATALTLLNALGVTVNLDLSSPASIPEGGEIFARVSVASTATTYNLQASVIGFYI